MISVIVPFFNSQEYLSDLINNLLKQTYSDLEVLLIDDGSTDSSRKIAQRYVNIDNRIHYIRIDHSGVSAARNVGLKQSKGKYIRFIDADDKLDFDSMEKLLQVMENDKEIDLVCGRFETNSPNIVYFGPSDVTGKRNIESFIQDFSFAPRTFFYGVIWNKLYRRDIIKQNNICFDEDIDWCEDFLFNLKYYEHCKYIYYLQDSIYKYYVHEGSLNSTSNERIRTEQKEILEQYRYQKAIEFIENVGCDPELFMDTWDYLKVMRKLIASTSLFSGRCEEKLNIWESYNTFKKMITSQDNRALIDRRYIEDSDIMVKMIYKSMKRGHYFGLFLFMIAKDFMSVHCTILKRLWRRRKRKVGTL